MGLFASMAGGLGEQMVDMSKTAQKRKADAEAATIDHEREKALQRLRDQGAMARQTAGDEAAMARTRAQTEGQMGVQTLAGEQAAARNAADNERAIKVEQMGIDAGKYAKTGSTAQDPRIKALVERYDFKTEASEGFDETGRPTTTERIKITDKVSGRVYSQEGDILRMANDKKPPVYPNDRFRAEQDLLRNPEAATSFYKTYHYLPIEYLEMIRSLALSNEGRGPLGTPSGE